MRRLHCKWINWPMTVASLCAIITFICGIKGFTLGKEGHKGYGIIEAFYQTLQLFTLESGPQVGHNIYLQIARFTGATTSGIAVIAAIMKVFSDKISDYSLSRSKRHIVVAGLGSIGYEIVKEYRLRGEAVVVIESDEGNDNVYPVRDMGAKVIFGDATDKSMLEKAKVDRAEKLFSCCKDDQTNFKVAVRAHKCKELHESKNSQKKEVLNTFVHIEDIAVNRIIKEHNIFTNEEDNFEISTFNYYEMASRSLFLENNFDNREITSSKNEKYVHIVIVGFGRMGQAVLQRAATTCYYANCLKKKTKITIIDRDFTMVTEKIKRYQCWLESGLDVCDVSCAEIPAVDGHEKNVSHVINKIAQDEDALLSVIICYEQELKSTCLTWRLRETLQEKTVNIFVRSSNKEGLIDFSTNTVNERHKYPTVKIFGSSGSTMTIANVTLKELDKLAMEIHANFHSYNDKDEARMGWNNSPEFEKTSCRAAADHVHVKLAALGYYSCPQKQTKGDDNKCPNGEEYRPITKIAGEGIRLLAPMEHSRFVAERLFDTEPWKPYEGGVRKWNCFEQNNEKDQLTKLKKKRINGTLVNWEDLLEDAKEQITKDHDQIEKTPKMLNAVGQAVYGRL